MGKRLSAVLCRWGWIPAVEHEVLAFRWTCGCGDDIVARVPGEVNDRVTIRCSNGHRSDLVWRGDCFGVLDTWDDPMTDVTHIPADKSGELANNWGGGLSSQNAFASQNQQITKPPVLDIVIPAINSGSFQQEMAELGRRDHQKELATGGFGPPPDGEARD